MSAYGRLASSPLPVGSVVTLLGGAGEEYMVLGLRPRVPGHPLRRPDYALAPWPDGFLDASVVRFASRRDVAGVLHLGMSSAGEGEPASALGGHLPPVGSVVSLADGEPLVVTTHKVAVGDGPERDCLGFAWPDGCAGDGMGRAFDLADVTSVLHMGYDSPRWRRLRALLESGRPGETIDRSQWWDGPGDGDAGRG